MDAAARKAVENFIKDSRQQGRLDTCDLCGFSGGWEPGELVTLPKPFGGGGVRAVTLVCSNCGHLRFVQADKLGLSGP
jgi:predicted RNA-binding Zn-ribbon protein involved in translation (DUF1610 family)